MTDKRSFEVGVILWLDQPAKTVAELAKGAEEAGFAETWLPDHYFLRDVFVSMAAIAQSTQRIRLGTAVAAVQLRHPTLIASSAATIDELSNGRMMIGIGPGGFEFASQLGLNPKSPLTMMREAITIMREMLRGGSKFKGNYFSAKGSKLTWQPRDIPIQIAARGPAMTELAGELADGVLIHGLNQSYIDFVKQQIRVGAERAKRSPEACQIGTIIDVEWNDENPALAVERMRPRLRVIAGGSWSDSMIPHYGLDPVAVAKLKAAVSAGDPNAPTLVTDQMVHVFGIAGTRDHVKKELCRLRDSGFSRVVLKFTGTPQEASRKMQDIHPIVAEVCS